MADIDDLKKGDGESALELDAKAFESLEQDFQQASRRGRRGWEEGARAASCGGWTEENPSERFQNGNARPWPRPPPL